jgi:hypothetical protein
VPYGGKRRQPPAVHSSGVPAPPLHCLQQSCSETESLSADRWRNAARSRNSRPLETLPSAPDPDWRRRIRAQPASCRAAPSRARDRKRWRSHWRCGSDSKKKLRTSNALSSRGNLWHPRHDHSSVRVAAPRSPAPSVRPTCFTAEHSLHRIAAEKPLLLARKVRDPFVANAYQQRGARHNPDFM